MLTSNAQTKPGFFWQGLLIILPAILLAGAGLWLLRQDRVLAEREAAEQAQQIAEEAQAQILEALQSAAGQAVWRAQFSPENVDPAQDPIRQEWWTHGWLSCRIDPAFQLVYPPSARSSLLPRPFEIQELDSAQQSLWLGACKTFDRGTSNPAIVASWEAFLASKPPPRFAAAALGRLGASWQQLGQTIEARAAYEKVLSDFPQEIGETGVGLAQFARLKLVQLALVASNAIPLRTEWLGDLVSNAVSQPSLLSPYLLRTAVDLERQSTLRWPALNSTNRICEDWLELWEIHELAREWHRALATQAGELTPTNVTGRWVEFHREWYLAQSVWGEDAPGWILGRSLAEWQKRLAPVLAQPRVPKYFALGLDLAGRSVVSGASTRVEASLSGGGNALAPPFQVRVLLADPDAFYARVRVRTRWFGSLIVVAAGAVVAGFVAAWRAFERQQHLSELKSNFVSSVSHELRAPIASIRLLAEELDDAATTDAGKVRQYYRFMVQECRRLSSLIENVLDFARIEQGRKQYEREPTDVTALVEQTVKLLALSAAESRIQLHLEVDAAALAGLKTEVWCDGRALQQALVNLVDNAIKHSPLGAEVTVGLTISGVGTVLLWVEDHGKGIPPEDHERIFERFYRRGSELRRETQGVGLGLAIVKHIIEAHGGRVRLRSAVGQGSRFTLELPVGEGTDPG